MRKNRKTTIKTIVLGLFLSIGFNSWALDRTVPVNNIRMNECSVVEEATQIQENVLNNGFEMLDAIDEQYVDLGFNPYEYLPHDFNPYEGMSIGIQEIVLVELEEEVQLGFDTKNYLPKNFNPYSCR